MRCPACSASIRTLRTLLATDAGVFSDFCCMINKLMDSKGVLYYREAALKIGCPLRKGK